MAVITIGWVGIGVVALWFLFVAPLLRRSRKAAEEFKERMREIEAREAQWQRWQQRQREQNAASYANDQYQNIYAQYQGNFQQAYQPPPFTAPTSFYDLPPSPPPPPRPQPIQLPEWAIVLGLQFPITRSSIDSAYRALVRKAHPDHGGSHEAMIRLNRAVTDARKALGH